MDTPLDRPRWRGTLNWRALDRLSIGVEYNPAAEEVGPLATFFVLTESARRPALFLGTSSDRIGSPAHRQSYYATVAKRLGSLPVAPYASLNYSEWEERLNVPFGVNVDLGHGFSARPMNDGRRPHLMASWSTDRVSVTALWVWFERAGAAVAVGF